jgi:hypothetical protein
MEYEMHAAPLGTTARLDAARTEFRDSPTTGRDSPSDDSMFPPNDTVGMGYFPDELGLSSSPPDALSSARGI